MCLGGGGGGGVESLGLVWLVGDDKDGGEEGFLIVVVCMECGLCV